MDRKPLTAAQTALLADIENGRNLNGVQDNSRIGRTLAALIRKGAVTADRHVVPAFYRYGKRGKRFHEPAFITFSNVKAA